MNQKLNNFYKAYGQKIINLYLFFSFAGYSVWQTYLVWKENRLDYIEVSFAIQNLVLVFLFLIRKDHIRFNTNLRDQTIALIAFYSGAAFLGQPLNGDSWQMIVSGGIIFLANVLGIFTLVHLGKSFGILIAYRELKSNGLYSIVRHPMYLTDILLRVGYLISHFNLFIVLAFFGSSACYIYRAILEERFLSEQPEYKEYMAKVRYRFIPYVF